jgi:hypothetical protein
VKKSNEVGERKRREEGRAREKKVERRMKTRI